MANNWSDLTKGSLQAAIDRTEFNQQISSFGIWTNTQKDGTLMNYGSSSCNNWASSTKGIYGGLGTTPRIDSYWTWNSSDYCSSSYPLYCFEQIVAAPSETPSTSLFPSPSVSPVAVFPTSFRLANDQSSLASVTEQSFDSNPKTVDWALSSGAGAKTVYVQFKVNNVWQDPISATIAYNSPQPTPSLSPSPVSTPPLSPRPSPISNLFSNLSANLTLTAATFSFNYTNSQESLFRVHLSTSKDLSYGTYYNFVTGSSSPLVVNNVTKMGQYVCGAILYWRVEAVYTGDTLSSIQGPVKVYCNTPPSPIPSPYPSPSKPPTSPSGHISASPNYINLSPGASGASTSVFADWKNFGNYAVVCRQDLSVGYNSTNLTARSGLSGNFATTTYVQAGHNYLFTLYNNSVPNCGGTVIASAKVVVVAPPKQTCYTFLGFKYCY